MKVVDIKNLSRIYEMGSQRVHALDNVSLSFMSGSFWAIMGASGSGKSTLLNILGCLDRPTLGDYILNNELVSNLSDDDLSNIRLKNIGFIFQSFNLLPHLSVEKNIELPLYYLGWDSEKSQERANYLAEMVGLSDRLAHKPSELSGGQRQRVAIARALANDPQIILADEPTGNLDSSTSLQIMELLQKLNEDQKKTIIMVTHEPDIAEYASHKLHMKDGKILEIQERGLNGIS